VIFLCGINGFNWKDEKLMKEMNQEIKHRGPDDEGCYCDKNITLGSVRLSIMDPSEKGHMPMFSNDENLAIIHNGEIYNFPVIKEELMEKGYKFSSGTDTEVLLYSYEEWGSNCVEKFNGMWAFAIYDKKNAILFLSRDRLGVKPLYYYWDGESFIFCSEIKGLLKHEIERKANEGVIYDYLYHNLVDHLDETFFEGIKKLRQGHNLKLNLKNKTLEITKYYDLKDKIIQKEDSKPSDIRRSFLKSVKRRLIADVPVGSCLSGGIDSSSIVCAMRNLGKDDIKVFSLVFPGKSIDETEYQKNVVEKTGVEWNRTTFTQENLLKDLEDFIYTQEEPTMSLSMYGQYRVMKLVHENQIKVVLDGQGADEILAGYHWFFGYYFSELFFNLEWIKLIHEINFYNKVHDNFSPIRNMLTVIMPIFIIKFLWMKKNNFISKDFFKLFSNRKNKYMMWNAKTTNSISLLAEIYFSLPQLLRYEDKNSMRWSVESRVPFCDYKFVEEVMKLPSDRKVGSGMTKLIFREAMKGILPEEILKRNDKIGFKTPDDELLKKSEGKKFFKGIISSREFKKRIYWNVEKIERMFEEHLIGKYDHSQNLWKVVILELWLRRWINAKR
jgi:asparagine synthase (glutamine-hydrolysing)